MYTTLVLFVSIISALFRWVQPENIELLKCSPPDIPKWGSYGPKHTEYLPGDVVYYFCNANTYLTGHPTRFCMDHGDWSGDTPTCDPSEHLQSVEQSSTKLPEDLNEAYLANDENRESCSSTTNEYNGRPTWTGRFKQPSEVLRIMIFLPKGWASYEVLLERSDGSEISCGRSEEEIERYDWKFYICQPPNNADVVAIHIRSLSYSALQLCEVAITAVSDPKCLDPHVLVESGNLVLSRRTAELVCRRGYIKGPNTSLTCTRNGVWTRKHLYCTDAEDVVEKVKDNLRSSTSSPDEREREFNTMQSQNQRERLPIRPRGRRRNKAAIRSNTEREIET